MNLDNGTVQMDSSLAITITEASRLLQVSKPTMYKLASQGDFPSFHVGKKILINRLRLQDWIDKQSRKEE